MAQKPQSRRNGKLLQAARQARKHLPDRLPPVFLLTDPARVPDIVAAAEALPRGWGLIYRHFGRPDRAAQGEALAHVARRRDLSFLVAADPELALKIGADGVHWPFAYRAASRKWRSRFEIMTVSAHGSVEARRAAVTPCDAIICSTVFASNSPSAGQPLGPVKFRSLAQSLPAPIYGLGGINSTTAGHIARFAGLAGIEGIAAAKQV